MPNNLQFKNNRYYSWSLVLYENQFTIINAITNSNKIISKWALSPLHQFDIFTEGEKKGEYKAPHYHLLITFKQNVSLNQIIKMFAFDSNVFGEKLDDRFYWFEYLTHSNAPDKYQYDPKEILTNDYKYFTRGSPIQETNYKMLEIIDNLINGMSYRDLVINYGRDFVVHYKMYYEMARLIALQEGKDLHTIISDYKYIKDN